VTTAWRPALQQLMALASEIHAMPESELATPAVLRRARTALAVPNAEFHGCELYSTVPVKGAALAGALLANPPLSREAPRLASRTLQGFLRRNGWRWPVLVPTTIVRFQSEMRSGEIGAGLGDWIVEHAIPGPPLRRHGKHPRWMRLFSLDGVAAPHVIYQAGPVAGLDREERRLQATLGAGIEEAAAGAAEGDSMALTVEHPSIQLSPERAPDLKDSELWRRNRLILLSKADALVVTDIGSQRAAFGSAMEVDLMAAQGGPILYLRSRGAEECSRYLTGRGEELDLSIHEYGSPDEARELTRAWLVARSNAIKEIGRRRTDRTYANEMLLRRLVPAYGRLELNRQMLICGNLGVSPMLVEAALEHPAATDLILGDRLAAFCEQVGIEDAMSEDALAGPMAEKPRAETLLEAARELDWDAPKIQGLWAGAVRQWETAGSVGRFSYYSRTDWIERERAAE
jgi:hypothetical protein